MRDRQRRRIDALVVDFDRPPDTVAGPVRLAVGQRDRAVDTTRVHGRGHRVAGAENVVLRNRAREHQPIGAGVAHPRKQVAGRLFGHRHVEINLVGTARDGGRFHVHVVEEVEPGDAHLGTLDACRVVPGALELTQLATNHFVAGLAADVDLADVHPAARIDEESECRAPFLAVDLGDGVDIGEGISIATEAIGQRFRGLREFFARINVAGLDQDQAHQLGLGQQQLTGKPNFADAVLRALGDIDRDVDLLLVRRDRNLRRIDLKFEVAPVGVVTAQRLQVGLQLLLRVLVVLGVPGEPARRRELHLLDQRALGKRLGADDVDIGDLRDIALLHGEVHRDAIAFLRRHRSRDLHRVITAIDVLALEFLFRPIERRAVENTRLDDADILQRLAQRVLVEFLGADDVDLADRRPLLDDDDQHAALDLESHVAEKPGRVQRLYRGGSFFVIDPVADLDRQIVEHGPGIGTLHPFDANVPDGERLECQRRGRESRREQYHEQCEPRLDPA